MFQSDYLNLLETHPDYQKILIIHPDYQEHILAQPVYINYEHFYSWNIYKMPTVTPG
jgi:hypothetical protein